MIFIVSSFSWVATSLLLCFYNIEIKLLLWYFRNFTLNTVPLNAWWSRLKKKEIPFYPAKFNKVFLPRALTIQDLAKAIFCVHFYSLFLFLAIIIIQRATHSILIKIVRITIQKPKIERKKNSIFVSSSNSIHGFYAMHFDCVNFAYVLCDFMHSCLNLIF